MNIIRKDATITPTGADTDFPGTFQVVLSTSQLDRDAETLLPDEWKQPLPEHITFDTDHGMSVATTIGSGHPYLSTEPFMGPDGKEVPVGSIIVDGTYSSLQRAQDTRTLVTEKHIRTTSVAFMSSRSKDAKGVSVVTRELLNGAFVAIPSNTGALVLSSKAAEVKLGARNSAKDMEHIQSIHDHASAMGADCPTAAKSASHVSTKAIVGSLEAAQERARDALNDAYAGPDIYVWLRATLPAILVFEIDNNSSDTETYQQDYTDDGSVVTLTGERRAVDVAEVVTPDPDEATEPAAAVAAAADAGKSASAAAVTKAAEDESIRLHAQLIAMQASVDLTD
jgi:hypothetical protein